MNCPYCTSENLRVYKSIDDGRAIKRVRECLSCGNKATTMETFDVIRRPERPPKDANPGQDGHEKNQDRGVKKPGEHESGSDLDPDPSGLGPDLSKQIRENSNTMSRPAARKSGLDSAELGEFRAWYESFPRKRARLDAEKAWAQTRGSRPPLALMLSTLEWQRKEFARREESAVPYPATYLRAGQFLDQRPAGAFVGPGKSGNGAPPAPTGMAVFCDWHRESINYRKPSKRPLATCPDCKHVAAASRDRVGEPQSLLDLGALRE